MGVYLGIVAFIVACHVLSHVSALSQCFDSDSAVPTISEDCLWNPASSAVSVSGARGASVGPPAVIASAAGTTGPGSASLTYVVLQGFQLSDPSSPQGLLPKDLVNTAAPNPRVFLRDVRILVDDPTLQQHVAFFRGLQGVTTYTDKATFLHVNYYANGLASWQSVGLLLANSLEDARSTCIPAAAASTDSANSSLASGNSSSSSPGALRGSRASIQQGRRLQAGAAERSPRYNYVLAATSATLVGHLQQQGSVDGPTPCLIYLDSNVTLSKPPVPAAGIPVARPMALVGLATQNTSINFYMQVNQLLMNYQWSNMTLDSLACENLAPGDVKSAELARPLSASSGSNFWPLYYNRSEMRLFLKNITYVFGSQGELDYYMFGATAYHSKLPYFKSHSQFMRNVIKTTTLKVGWQTDSSIQVIRCFSGSCNVEDSTYRLQPVVAPRMPKPAPLPVAPELQLRPAEKSPLVMAVGDAQSLRDQLEPLTGSEAGRPHVVLLRSNISLQALMQLPPSTTSSSSSSSSSTSAASASPPTLAGFPPSGIPVPAPLSILGDLSTDVDADYADTNLHLGFGRSMLDVTASNSSKSQLQVQHLRLQGLSQGPEAAAATDLSSPHVWTLLGWAFRRSADGGVMLSGCELELPVPEFDRLAELAQQGGGQVVLKLAGDMRSTGGDGLVVLTGISTQLPVHTSNSSSGSRRRLLMGSRKLLLSTTHAGERALWVDSLSAQGLSGTRLMLSPADEAAAVPGGYFWPAPPAGMPAAGGVSRTAVAAAAAVAALVAVAAAAGGAYVVVRRRRARQQQQLLPKPDGLRSSAAVSVASTSSGPGSGSANSRDAWPAGAVVGNSQRSKAAGALDASGQRCVKPAQRPAGGAAAAAAWGSHSTMSSDTAAASCDQGAPGPASAQQVVQQLGSSGAAEVSQLQHTGGLSDRLASAISSLQQDITRRRIGGILDASQMALVHSKQAAGPGSSKSARDQGSSTSLEEAQNGTAAVNPNSPAQWSEAQRSGELVTAPGQTGASPAALGAAATAELQIQSLIGRGSFANVYRAIWRGRCVALKVVQLPAGIGEGGELCHSEKARERMAVIEAVIGVTMSHPNVVQVYTFALQPLYTELPAQQAGLPQRSATPSNGTQQQRQPSQDGTLVGWELQLIQEYCEEGSLRTALNQQRLVDPSAPSSLPAVQLVLALAHDIACAMLHLHTEQIVHSDLKAGNCLLTKSNLAPFLAATSSSSEPGQTTSSNGHTRGLKPGSCAALLQSAQAAAGGRLIAKVADFGLSFALDPESTHISHMHAGTPSHMAPELLLDGRASKASDVYAFGILLWELVTGLRAFQGMPVALVGHNVTQLGLRPPWVPGVSPALKQLVEDCWAQDPEARPSFSSVLQRLEQLLQLTPEELAAPAAATAAAGPTGSITGSGSKQQQDNAQVQQEAARGNSPLDTSTSTDAVTGGWTM